MEFRRVSARKESGTFPDLPCNGSRRVIKGSLQGARTRWRRSESSRSARSGFRLVWESDQSSQELSRRDDWDSLVRPDAQQVAITGDDVGSVALVGTGQHGVVIGILGDHPELELSWGHLAMTVEAGDEGEELVRIPPMVFPDLLFPQDLGHFLQYEREGCLSLVPGRRRNGATSRTL